MSDWLIGRQEIADYARVSVWSVTAMAKAGLVFYGKQCRGSSIRTTKKNVDEFFINNPDFTAAHYHKPSPRCRNI